MRIYEPERQSYFQDYWKNKKNQIILKRKIRRKEVRDFLINFFGGKCQICGFSDRRALQIDHIYGGGSKELKLLKTEYQFHLYRLAILNPKEFRRKYQLLCANCNWIKG